MIFKVKNMLANSLINYVIISLLVIAFLSYLNAYWALLYYLNYFLFLYALSEGLLC